MSLRSLIVPRIAERILSERTQMQRRARFERARARKGEPHKIMYFHEAADPYAHLALHGLSSLAARYDVEIDPYVCAPPPDWAAPERARLKAYSLLDARRLGQRAGTKLSDTAPPQDRLRLAEQAFAGAIERGVFPEQAAAISAALWENGVKDDWELGDAAAMKEQGSMQRERLGHYLGGTFWYGGEWYWGLDRLHYLEARLQDLRLLKAGAQADYFFRPPADLYEVRKGNGSELHFYCSFRSPYTYISAERVKALADAYGATLRLRFVLPMVMRSLPVPRMKSGYITFDTAREARRQGIAFGRICDPVGRPVERGYAVLAKAIEAGRGYEFAYAFMRGVWSQGIDVGSDRGLRRIVEASGLDWHEARGWLRDESWRDVAETNRQELLNLGLWGVPSFRVGDVSAWGQDRLWVIEEALRAKSSV